MRRSTTLSCAIVAYAGIDFHKRFSVVTLGNKDGQVTLQEKLPNDELHIRKFFEQYPGISCAIENCRGTEWYVELLKSLGLNVEVANSFAVKLISESRCKTDKIDSRILMELLAKGFLPTCYQPSRDERRLRERLRWRTQLVRSRTQYKNRAHALLDKENKCALLDSRKQRNNLMERSGLSAARQEMFEKHLEVIEHFENLIGWEDNWIIEAARANPEACLLKTIPGIGDISALLLLAELGDISRFQKARNVASYFGLVPRLYSSADTRRLGPITKQGSGLIRWVLVQDAWMAIRQCKQLSSRYARICKRKGKKVAIVAIARTLAEIVFWVLKEKKEFDASKLTLG